MQVAKNTVVAIDYVLKDDDGQVLDSSEGRAPLSYLHGTGAIIPGLEQELDGRQAGDQLQVAVTAKEGYGERTEALQQDVPRDQFTGIHDLELGMQFRVESNAGPMFVRIVRITNTNNEVECVAALEHLGHRIAAEPRLQCGGHVFHL